MDAQGLTLGTSDATESRSLSTNAWVAASIAVLFAASVNLFRVTVPAPWQDEAATWVSTQRSLPELWSMLQRVDAVHGLYYLVVRGWMNLFGDSVTSLRLLSVAAVAVGAGLAALLAALVFHPKAALWAGLCYGMLPQATWSATEGRSYALSAAATTAAMLAFWVAVRSRHWVAWVAYTLLLIGSVHLFLYSALAFVGLGLALFWLPRSARTPAAVATAVGALACIPFVRLAISQSKQVSWVANAQFGPREVLLEPFWGTTAWAQALGGLLTIAATITVALSMRSPEHRATRISVLAWLILPTALLVAAGALFVPMYLPRYVTYSFPALALVLGHGIWSLQRNWQRWVALTLVVAASFPAFLASRQPDAKSSVAPAISMLAARAQPGDAVYVAKWDVNEIWWAFPDQLAGLERIGENSGREWRGRTISWPSVSASKLDSELDGVERVWIFAVKYYDPAQAEAGLAKQGFERVEQIRVDDGLPTTLVLMERSPSR